MERRKGQLTLFAPLHRIPKTLGGKTAAIHSEMCCLPKQQRHGFAAVAAVLFHPVLMTLTAACLIFLALPTLGCCRQHSKTLGAEAQKKLEMILAALS